MNHIRPAGSLWSASRVITLLYRDLFLCRRRVHHPAVPHQWWNEAEETICSRFIPSGPNHDHPISSVSFCAQNKDTFFLIPEYSVSLLSWRAQSLTLKKYRFAPNTTPALVIAWCKLWETDWNVISAKTFWCFTVWFYLFISLHEQKSFWTCGSLLSG